MKPEVVRINSDQICFHNLHTSKFMGKKDYNRLKQLRQLNQKNTYESQQALPIYDEVTDLEFNQIAKRALLEDDFVVDDNGQGYVGRGLEDWDAQPESDTESDQSQDIKNKSPKKKKKRKVHDFFSDVKKQVVVKKEVMPVKKDQELLGDLMKDLDSELLEKTGQIKQYKQPSFSSLIQKPKFNEMGNFNTSAAAYENVKIKQEPVEYGSNMIVDDNMGFDHQSDEDLINEMKQEPVLSHVKKELPAVRIATIQTKSNGNIKKFLPNYVTQEPVETTVDKTNTSWNEIKDKFNVNEDENIKIETNYYESNDAFTYFYYLDAYEKNGKVYLFGKVFDFKSKKYVSCCLTVNNMERNLYLLPRQNSGVGMMEVYQEFDTLRKKQGIKNFKSKPVERNYCFEIPKVPSKTEYLKVVYGFNEPEIPVNCTGSTFERIFGVQTKALELFLIKRRIMGPCWLKIEKAEKPTKCISFCTLELTVDSPKFVSVVGIEDGEVREAPKLTVMSLNLRTIMDVEKSRNEIVLCGILIYQNVNPDGETINPTGLQTTLIRKVKNVPWPADFEKSLTEIKSKVQTVPNEKALLNLLISFILRHDPDIIVGHNVIDFDLDVLLQRMKFNQVSNWSCLGRLKRSEWPKMQAGAGGTNDSTFAERAITSGRIMCDTYRAAKDYLPNLKSYSLSSLATTQFKESRPDIQYDKIESCFWKAEELVEMIKHSKYDTYLVMNLMFKMQVIPLTKQLTNLAGNLWSRTMTGARSERNEFLLLHEFHAAKYITPDKVYNEQKTTAAAGRKKAAYAGGLVLEPKAGLYDKYVLLLDFNSLYPSIIQEFNICYSTVIRQYEDGDVDQLPDIPDLELEIGILPKLVKSLVERRKQVKLLMKEKGLDANQLSSV